MIKENFLDSQLEKGKKIINTTDLLSLAAIVCVRVRFTHTHTQMLI